MLSLWLPELIAETHVEVQVNWVRFGMTIGLFLAVGVIAFYFESRGAAKKK